MTLMHRKRSIGGEIELSKLLMTDQSVYSFRIEGVSCKKNVILII